MKKLLGLIVAAAVSAAPVYADSSLSTADIDAVRQKLREGKTEAISEGMNISDAGTAATFWALYRDYENEFRSIGDRRASLIQDYLKSFTTMDNEIAASLMDRALKNQEDALALRRKYAARMSKEISPVIAARFLQVEGNIQKFFDLEIDGQLPTIQQASDLKTSNQG